jgi:outer membrane murein-binding lipoprotein Lpp
MSPTRDLRYRMHHTAALLLSGAYRRRPHDEAAALLHEAAAVIRQLEVDLAAVAPPNPMRSEPA